MRDYTQLCFQERSKIECYLARGLNIGKIASLLNRHVSTIGREISRNSEHGYYNAQRAHCLSSSRCCRKPYKFTVNSSIYKYVLAHLKAGWSPEQIAGRMKRLKLRVTVSTETIYQYIYKHGNKKLFYYLPSKRKQRRTRHKRKNKRAHFREKNIKYRPFKPSDRSIIGHWEGDTIRFSKSYYQSVTTLVERKSRLIKIVKNDRSTSTMVMKNIKDLIIRFHPDSWKTITFDQGSEFSDFYQIERNTKSNVFYSDVSSPWQRGTNENLNRQLRRMLLKKMNPDEMTPQLLSEIEYKLNTKPRKSLGFRTPLEVYTNV